MLRMDHNTLVVRMIGDTTTDAYLAHLIHYLLA